MITYRILTDDAIVVVEPSGPLSETDFAALTEGVDAYLESHEGSLRGLLIHTREFPGWEDLEGLVGHFRFVRDHHQQISRVAFACDSKLTALAPKFAKHFVSAEVRSFEFDQFDEALAWLRSSPSSSSPEAGVEVGDGNS